jgi:hypothetical protein
MPGEFVNGLAGMMLGVQFARFVAMMLCVEVMGAGDMGMVGGLLVVAGRMGLGRGLVVSGGVFVMRCRVPVMLDLLLMGHVFCG